MSAESETQQQQEVLTVQPDPALGDTEMRQQSAQQQRDVAKNFNIMIGQLGDDYFKLIHKMAKWEEYTFTLKKPTGNKVPDPLDETQMIDEFSGWEQKTYKRLKITTAEYQKIESLRGEYNSLKDDTKAIAAVLAKMYRYLAYVYLQMPYSDFLRGDWEEIKPALDACNFSTVYGMRHKELGAKNSQAIM
jgi:hypothetical protein